jgi:holo-[acyl-carrier protein] synthase
MRVLGHGIDIVPLSRVQELLAHPDGEWVAAAFTEAEQAQADSPPNHISYFAGRYAGKEAVVKALGTGFSDDVAWLDVQILRLPTGAPAVQLSGGASTVADHLGVTRWLISISHSGEYAVASAIAVAD